MRDRIGRDRPKRTVLEPPFRWISERSQVANRAKVCLPGKATRKEPLTFFWTSKPRLYTFIVHRNIDMGDSQRYLFVNL